MEREGRGSVTEPRINKALFSSLRTDYKTPRIFYQKLDDEFHFDFDPCPINPSFDGLEVEWGKSNFVNPPYGRQMGKWIKKGYQEYLKSKTVVFLIPARTDTIWWHEYIMKAAEIRFIKGRLHFDDCKKSGATFPSVVVVFKWNQK